MPSSEGRREESYKARIADAVKRGFERAKQAPYVLRGRSVYKKYIATQREGGSRERFYDKISHENNAYALGIYVARRIASEKGKDVASYVRDMLEDMKTVDDHLARALLKRRIVSDFAAGIARYVLTLDEKKREQTMNLINRSCQKS